VFGQWLISRAAEVDNRQPPVPKPRGDEIVVMIPDPVASRPRCAIRSVVISTSL
jgi:hypothetical protein